MKKMWGGGMKRYIIVGGVAAGATAAARLRRLDEDAEIILMERGGYVSYANCGLPYYIGGEIAERDALFVATKESIESKYRIDVRDYNEVLSVDPEAKTVQVKNTQTGETYEESYTKLLLATGSSPIVPPLPGVDGERVFTLWTVPDTDQIKSFIEKEKPRRAVVVGGGFIGLEMVENLVHQGVQVDLVEMAPQVMGTLDPDMSKILENHLVDEGVRLHLGKGLASIQDGGRKVTLDDDSTLDCDMVLLSIGVRPNNQLPRAMGMELSERGYVVTDEGLRTSLPDIYAAGDMTLVTDSVSGEKKSVPLAGPANKQGRIAADNMVADEEGTAKETPYRYTYEGTQGTGIARIFEMTAAFTGQNEKALQRRGLTYGEDYAVALLHPQSHAGYFPGALPLCLKLVFDLKDGKILGAQAVGYNGVDKRIDVIATALRFGATVYDLTRLELAYAPPYSSAKDPVNMAGYIAANILDGITEPVFWTEALEMTKQNQHQLLDIREDEELLMSKVENTQHIPLTELRDRLDELDKDTTYYVFCAVGLRGYLAERILKQNGFKVKNIMGGMQSYHTLFDKHIPPTSEDLSDLPVKDVTHAPQPDNTEEMVLLNVCGLSCPGPIVQVAKKIETLESGQHLYVKATDPGFTRDIDSWCENTGHELIRKGKEDDAWFAEIKKRGREAAPAPTDPLAGPREKTMIVFSGDLDKAIASFIIANGAAAMGNKVNMFFTFWGLNILRKPEKVAVKKDFMSGMFAKMMPRGSKKLGLSKMNFCGAGPKMIRSVMEKNNIDSLESLMKQAMEAGVKMTACQMSMDVMGITEEELIDGVEVGGVATMLNDNDRSNMNLFI